VEDARERLHQRGVEVRLGLLDVCDREGGDHALSQQIDELLFAAPQIAEREVAVRRMGEEDPLFAIPLVVDGNKRDGLCAKSPRTDLDQLVVSRSK